MIKYIYQLIKEYFIYRNRVKITKEGEIYLAEIDPYIINETELSSQVTYSTKKLIKTFYNEIEKKSEEYDDYMITIIVLVSFTTREGYRAIEKNIASITEKADSIDYTFYHGLIKAKLTKLFEEYIVESISIIKVKII